jgi:hypothetical protein
VRHAPGERGGSGDVVVGNLAVGSVVVGQGRGEFGMRAKILILSAGLVCAGAGPGWAARPILDRLPSAVTRATPGTGSAPVLSAGMAGAPAVTALVRRKPARRPRGPRLGSIRPF